MSDQIGSGAWVEQWLESQREAWTRLFSGAGGSEASVTKSPPNLLAALGTDVPRSAQDAARKMLQVSESFLGVTRSFWELLRQREARGASSDGTAATGDWSTALDQLRRTMGGELSKLFSLPADQGTWLAGWQQLVMTFANAGNALQGTAGLMPQLPGFPGIPGEVWPRLAKAGLRYQQALARLATLLARVGSEAVDTLAKLVGPEAKTSPTSLRAVYDLWIDCGEKAYSAAAHGAEFAAAQQELNEAILDLRHVQQEIGEHWMRLFDLPTRAEVNTINRRVVTLRRRLREVEEELETLRRSR